MGDGERFMLLPFAFSEEDWSLGLGDEQRISAIRRPESTPRGRFGSELVQTRRRR
jgi:hypothetical protein